MNKSIIAIVFGLVGVFAASSVFAKSTEEDLAIKLKQRYPKMSIGSVNESAVAGIYEVIPESTMARILCKF
jgi:stalled ribosome rescue protein Dom34